jgi:general secretion pathway protein F
MGARLGAAWQRHPVHALFAHRRRLALLEQLSGYLRSGTGLPVALGEMARFAGGARARRKVSEAKSKLDAGAGLIDALRGVGLDEPTVELLAAAEETGTLGRALPDAITRMRDEQGARRRFLVALVHPAYLTVLYVLLGPLLTLGAALRGGATIERLPALWARGAAGNLLQVAGLAAIVVALPLVPALLDVEAAWDRLALKLPLVGALRREVYASRLLGLLGAALGAGANAVRALELAVRATGSAALQPQRLAVARLIHGGAGLAEVVQPWGLLDGPALGVLAVAERTGELDTTLVRLAGELAASAARRLRMLLAVAVGLLVIALVAQVVVSTVSSFVGTVRGLDDEVEKLMKQ